MSSSSSGRTNQPNQPGGKKTNTTGTYSNSIQTSTWTGKHRTLIIPMILPLPDRYGNYWITQEFDQLHNGDCPAIFKAGGPKHVRSATGSEDDLWCNPVRYFASLGSDRGILFKGQNIRYFNTPEEALKALKEAVNG